MKKFLAALSLALASTAVCALPEGYVEIDDEMPNSRAFVNEATGGKFMIQMGDVSAETTALDMANAAAEKKQCKAKISGNEEMAEVEDCEVNGVKWNMAYIVKDQKVILLLGNDKVTKADIDGFQSEIFGE